MCSFPHPHPISLCLSHSQLKCDIRIISLPLLIPKTWPAIWLRYSSHVFPPPTARSQRLPLSTRATCRHNCTRVGDSGREREETGESIALVVIKWEGFQTSEGTTCGAIAITEDTDLQTSDIFPTKNETELLQNQNKELFYYLVYHLCLQPHTYWGWWTRACLMGWEESGEFCLYGFWRVRWLKLWTF